ncbi:hypothetical protein AABB24_006591 [Solanum stoloniferum]|uniref:Secreted protein n=1 Tax=Solanum stoloniferum TaxID=62892 RepID=A0ABD2V4W9_9SOLN
MYFFFLLLYLSFCSFLAIDNFFILALEVMCCPPVRGGSRQEFAVRPHASCGHNLHLKFFQKWIGQGKDTRVKCRSQISRQMINQSTTNRLGTGDCIKVMLLQVLK